MKQLLIILTLSIATFSVQAQTTPAVKATICKGITKAGKPCKKHTKNTNGYCQFHQPVKK